MGKNEADRPALKIANDDVELTAEMVEAGEEVILGQIGGVPIGGPFSASDLARAVYSAMERARH